MKSSTMDTQCSFYSWKMGRDIVRRRCILFVLFEILETKSYKFLEVREF